MIHYYKKYTLIHRNTKKYRCIYIYVNIYIYSVSFFLLSGCSILSLGLTIECIFFISPKTNIFIWFHLFNIEIIFSFP